MTRAPRRSSCHPAALPLGRRFALGVLVALSLLPVVLGGLPYSYCVPMARVGLACCCAGRHGTEETQGPALAGGACCESYRVATAPPVQAPLPFDVTVLPAALVAVMALEPCFAVPAARQFAERPAVDRRARAGPSPPLYVLKQSYLC